LKNSFKAIEVFSIALLFLLLNFNLSAQNNFNQKCARIVSLSPSVSESLHSLNLYQNVVGISKFDTYPEQKKDKTVIGGFLDPNIEVILQLNPTLIVGLKEHTDLINKLNKFNIKSILVDHRNIDSFLDGLKEISNFCGVEVIGQELINSILKELDKCSVNNPFDNKKAVIVVSRDYSSDKLKELYLSGDDGFYSSLFKYCNIKNAYTAKFGSINSVSVEAIYHLKPDIIFEILPPDYINIYGYNKLIKPWISESLIDDATKSNIYLLDQDWATIPGPRLINFIEFFKNPPKSPHGTIN
jgi:iron complex transport system substrate-binding protein